MPMQYSWCVETTEVTTIANALKRVMSECTSQGVCVSEIEAGTDTKMTNSRVPHTSAVHDIQLTDLTEISPAPHAAPALHAQRRMQEIKSARNTLTSHLFHPLFSELTRYSPIEANAQVNRRRSVSTGHRPHEDFTQKRIVYSADVGLQIGTPCVGTTPYGRDEVGVYLYPEPLCGTHLMLHMEDGTTRSTTTIQQTTEEYLWRNVHYESDSDDPTPTNTSLTMEDADHASSSDQGCKPVHE
jgi:hypothetical protein